MRKLALFVVALLAANLTFAQKGIEFGVSFTPGSPWVLNDEDFAEGDDLNYRGTFGWQAGLTLGYNFTDGIGIQTGLMFNQLGQNYINYNSAAEKADMDVFSRRLGYTRIPVLIKFNGDIDASSSSYFRIGPHFDLLRSARYNYTNVSGLGVNQDVDLRNYNQLITGDKYEVYNSMAIGITLEMGGAVNINEALRLLFLLHMSGSFNTEGADAGDAGAQIYGESLFTNVNPFPSSPSGNRQSTYNVMGGFTVGFNYVLSFD
jgi:hypothetical protein